MRIELTNEQNLALANVLRNALSVLRQGESEAVGDFASLKRGYAALEDVHRRLTGLELSHKEANFLANLIENVVSAVAQQEGAASDSSAAGILKDLHKKVSVRTLQLDGMDIAALAIVLRNAREALRQAEVDQDQPGTVSLLETGQSALDELYRRLWTLDLDETEARFLKNVVQTVIGSFQSGGEQQAQDKDLVTRTHNVDLLQNLASHLTAGSVQLTAEEKVALGIVAQNALAALQAQMSEEKDADALKSYEKGEQTLQDLQHRLTSLDVSMQEAQFLGHVLETTTAYLEETDKADSNIQVLGRLRDRTQALYS